MFEKGDSTDTRVQKDGRESLRWPIEGISDGLDKAARLQSCRAAPPLPTPLELANAVGSLDYHSPLGCHQSK